MAYQYHGDAASRENTSGQHRVPGQETSPPALTDLLMQPGLEVAPANGNDKYYVNKAAHGDKQAVNQEEKEVAQSDGNFYEPLMPSTWRDPKSQGPRSHRICGMKRRLFWILLVVLLFLIALAIGLGVGLTSRHSDEAASEASTPDTTSSSISPSSSSDPPSPPTANEDIQIGGSIDPSYYTGSGAWNGSGIAYIWQNFTEGWDDILTASEFSHVVYFQHHSGEIQWMRQTSDYTWKQGPLDLLVVAADARNSTPISAVQYTANDTNYWNVFYIDSDNLVRQRSGNNRTTGWTEGSISKAKLTAWNGDLVGLTSCWSAINESVPIRLFYASNETAFEEYLWWAEEDDWVWQKTWGDKSGAAGVGCSRDFDGYRYVGLVNPSNQLEIWYQPVREIQADWEESEYYIPNAHPASSITLSLNYTFYQEDSTNAMRVAKMDWKDYYTRNSSSGISPEMGLAGISGTHMSAMQVGDYTWMFYQRNGRDITWLELAPNDDLWKVETPVPFSQ